MSKTRKLWLGVLSFTPAVFLVIGVVALVAGGGDDASFALFYVAVFITGIFDALLAAFLIPHVHDNPRVGKDWKIAWIAGLGIPYITIGPIYWLKHILPDTGEREEPEGPLGGAWYADPWGEAPLRWWDGRGWTDWVTGPPGGGH